MAEENQSSDSGASYSRTEAAKNEADINKEDGVVARDLDGDGVISAEEQQIAEENEIQAAIPDTILDVMLSPTPGNLFNFLIKSTEELGTALVMEAKDVVTGQHRGPEPTPKGTPPGMKNKPPFIG